jgi:hypothetical protein
LDQLSITYAYNEPILGLQTAPTIDLFISSHKPSNRKGTMVKLNNGISAVYAKDEIGDGILIWQFDGLWYEIYSTKDNEPYDKNALLKIANSFKPYNPNEKKE